MRAITDLSLVSFSLSFPHIGLDVFIERGSERERKECAPESVYRDFRGRARGLGISCVYMLVVSERSVFWFHGSGEQRRRLIMQSEL